MDRKVDYQISVVNQAIIKIIGEGDLSTYDQLITKNIRSHCPASWKELHQIEIYGQENAKQVDEHYSQAFHPMSVTIDEITPFKGDKFFTRWRCEKFHANQFYGIKATNRKVILGGQTIFCVGEEMKINEVWHSWDMLGLLCQIDWQPQLNRILDKANMQKIIDKSSRLTIREKECLRLQIKGKTAKETAALLFISPRTVEYHFENVKDKLDCKNKKELFAIAQILESHHLLLNHSKKTSRA